MIAQMLSYDFMRRALLVGALLAVIIPCIGVVVVLRRLSMIGDALSHTSLAGVAAGLYIGVNPTVGATVACIIAALCIELIRSKMPQYAELAIAVVLSAGVGLAGVFSGLSGGGTSFQSFLFGSIVSVIDFELLYVCAVSVVVLVVFLLLWRELFAVCFDERGARLAGVPVGCTQALFTVMTAVTVSVAARTVGALIVSSLMVLPVTCAMQLGRSYRGTVLASVGFGMLFTLSGLGISFHWGLRPGATIVLVGVAGLALLLAAGTVLRAGRGGGS